MKQVKILGTDCSKSKELCRRINEVAEENHIDIALEEIDDISQFIRFGIVSIPALIVDGDVVTVGNLPDKTEILKKLQ